MNRLVFITLVLVATITNIRGQVRAPAAPPAGVTFNDGPGFRWSYNCNYENSATTFGTSKSNVVPCSTQCLNTSWCVYFVTDPQSNCYLQRDGILKASTTYTACGFITSRGSFNGGIAGPDPTTTTTTTTTTSPTIYFP